MNRKTLIVGIGSHHGDDRFGWFVAESLSAESREGCEVRLAASPIDLLGFLEDVARLVVCDACRGVAQPGEVHRWTWPCAEFEKLNFDGTHNLNLPAVLGLAAELCILPADVVVWTVEAEYVGPGEPVSPKVAAAAAKVADRIWSELTHA